MKIGIDGLPLTQSLAGIGHYTFELVRHLSRDNEVDVISPKPFLETLATEQDENASPRLIRKKVNPITGRWWSFGLPRYLRSNKLDVFHGTNFEIPVRASCATVLTIHDLSLLLYPQTHQRRRVWRARRRLPLMARRANMIITLSDAIRDEIHQHLRIPLDRIVTVYCAARDVFRPMDHHAAEQIRRQLKIADDFILYAGTIEPRKNIHLLLKAFAESGLGKERGMQLVLAGKRGWMVDDLYRSLEQEGIGGRVTCTGYLTDEELCALYSSCRLFVYPSLYEGFGLPPLEAMACGAPVVASRIPSIAEATGAAARLVSPQSALELAGAMRELVDNDSDRKRLIDAGLKRASEFSWSATAEHTQDVYVEAIDRFKRQRSK
jgi:glycosyltransferase involved in cell wall biosynthesis